MVKQALEALAPGMESIYLAADDSSTEVADSLTAAPAQSYLLPGAPRDAEWLVNTWRRASMLADQSRVGAVLVLDEIQKIPRWSDIVKGLWDADRAVGRKLHAVVLGSSPLLMQQGLTESLAGRYETIRMSHWSFLEMFQAFDLELDKFIYFGGYPGAVHDIGDEARWRDYIRDSLIAPNIDKDILMMTRVDKPALLKLLFNLGCELSGQTWSYNKMLGQLKDAGNTTTLAHYLGLLGDAGLLVGFQKYAGRAHRKRGSSPKLNVLNTALMSVASGYSFEQAKADRTFWGRLVESAIGAHLQNTASSDTRVSYWRASPYEVDFVLERGR
ncbi:MAG: ATP-binding protein, partial [Gammaproteobacteria bacterium]